MKKIIVVVVCKNAYVRSWYVRNYLIGLLKEKGITNVVVDNAGIDPFKPKKLLTQEMVEKADLVFAMDSEIYDYIAKNFSPPLKKLINLDIYDVYNERYLFDSHLVDNLVKRNQWNQEQRNNFFYKPEISLGLTLESVLMIKGKLIWQLISKLILDGKEV